VEVPPRERETGSQTASSKKWQSGPNTNWESRSWKAGQAVIGRIGHRAGGFDDAASLPSVPAPCLFRRPSHDLAAMHIQCTCSRFLPWQRPKHAAFAFASLAAWRMQAASRKLGKIQEGRHRRDQRKRCNSRTKAPGKAFPSERRAAHRAVAPGLPETATDPSVSLYQGRGLFHHTSWPPSCHHTMISEVGTDGGEVGSIQS
jgi:hypothetical protein